MQHGKVVAYASRQLKEYEKNYPTGSAKLLHMVKEHGKVIAYASRQLKEYEKNYPIGLGTCHTSLSGSAKLNDLRTGALSQQYGIGAERKVEVLMTLSTLLNSSGLPTVTVVTYYSL